MRTVPRRALAWGGVALVATMWFVSPIRHLLESRMTVQMLGQIPLLVAGGWLVAAAVPARLLPRIQNWNQGGVTGLVLAVLVASFWMLPRSLDASVTEPLMAGAKYLSVPLLIGLPFALSWPHMSFVVRGIFLAEVVATLFRLGWLYRVSPVRLCNSYGLDDQQRIGSYMLILGGGLLCWLAWKVLLGGTMPSTLPPGSQFRAPNKV